MQICSLCSKEYPDTIRVCHLSHCSFCGSTKIQKNERFSGIDIPTLIILGGFFAILFVGIFMDKIQDLIVILAIMLGFLIITVPLRSKLNQNYVCTKCLAKNFVPISKIELGASKMVSKNRSSNDVIKNGLNYMMDEQKSHHRRDWMIRIIGTIALVAVAIFGLLFQEIITKWVQEQFGLF